MTTKKIKFFPKIENIVISPKEMISDFSKRGVEMPFQYAIIIDGYVIATNMQIFVRINLNDYGVKDYLDQLEGVALDYATLKALSNKKIKAIKQATIPISNCTVIDGVLYYNDFDNLKEINEQGVYVFSKFKYPSVDHIINVKNKNESISKISISSKKIKIISEVIITDDNEDELIYNFTGHNKPINVTCPSFPIYNTCVIMPSQIQEN